MALSRALSANKPLALALFAAFAAVGLLAGYDPRLGIIAAFGLVYVYVSLTDLTAALVLLIIVIFAESTPLAGPALSATKIAGLLLTTGWVARLATHPAERAKSLPAVHPRLTYLLALFLTWAIVSVSWASDTPAAVGRVSEFLLLGVLYVIVHSAVRTRGQAIKVIAGFIAGATISAVYGLAAGQTKGGTERLVSTVGDPNFLAAVLIAGIALAIVAFLAARNRPLLRIGALIALVLCLVTFVLTGSRGGILGLAVALMVAVALGGRSRGRIAIAATCLVLVAGCYYALYAPDSLISRIDSATQGEVGTQDTRLTIWTVGWRMVEDHPVVGVGAGNFQNESIHYVLQPGTTYRTDRVIDQPPVAHNTFLGPLAELGVIGLALFLALIVASVTFAWRAAVQFARNEDPTMEILSRGLVVALAGMLTAGFFLSAETDKFLWLMLALGPALFSIAREMETYPSTTPAGAMSAAERPSARPM